MKSFLYRLLPLLLIGLIIYLLSSISDPYDLMPYDLYYWLKSDELFGTRIIDIVGGIIHLSLFGLLSAFFVRVLIGKGKLRISLLVLAFIITALFGFMDEIHQIFVPGRAYQIIDISLDVLGAAVGVVFYFKWHQNRKSKLNRD